MRGINLLKLAAALDKLNLHADFVSKVKQATSVASAHQDLRHADEALLLLKRLVEGEPSARPYDPIAESLTADEGVFAGALLSQSVILYARSTDTKPIDRYKWFSSDLFSKKQKPWHKEVMQFRDRSLAHFGYGIELKDGPTIEQALVWPVKEVAEPATVAYVETRALSRGSLSARLRCLVDILLPLAFSKYEQRINELFDVFQRDLQADPQAKALAAKCLFDSRDFATHPTPNFDETATETRSHYMLRRPLEL